MTLPSDVLRSQARFARRLPKSGRSLTLIYEGPWTRAPMNGFVARAPLGPTTKNGILSLGGVPSDLKREKMERWGRTFLPDGDLLLAADVPTLNLSAVVDGRVGGIRYDVVYAVPLAFTEDRCALVWVRTAPLYNRLVTVRLQDPLDRVDHLLLANLPCRLTPQDAGPVQEEGLGLTAAASVTLECPYVAEGAGILGAGVADAGTAGDLIALSPKRTVIIDDPAAYGRTGPILTYRVAGVNEDAGGDLHHMTFALTLA